MREKTRTLTVEATPRTTHPLHVEWLSGKDEDGEIEFVLESGAGVGSPRMAIYVTRNGRQIGYEQIDVRPLVQEWVSQIVKEADSR